MQLRYRPATHTDMERVVDLLWGFAEEVKGVWPDQPGINLERVRFWYSSLMLSDMILTCWDGDVAVGVLALQPVNWWWSDEGPLEDVWFYVRKEYRNGLVGFKLARWACWLADRMKRDLKMTQTTGTNVRKLDGMMKRLGFENVGSVHLRFRKKV